MKPYTPRRFYSAGIAYLLRRFRQVILLIAGYRPKLYWNVWGINFDKDVEQINLHEWNILAIDKIKDLNTGIVIEIGCGFGRNIVGMIERGIPAESIIGVDISEVMLKKCRKNLHGQPVLLRQADVCNLPFADKSVDVAYASLVLMHVIPDRMPGALDELFRITRGYILILDEYREVENNLLSVRINGFTYAHNFHLVLERYPCSIQSIDILEKWVLYVLKLE